MAMADLGTKNTVTEADPDALMHFLAKNDPAINSPFKAKSGAGLYPLCSSPQVAMVLVFHAWKRPGLKLVELGYHGLIRNKAPYVHPTGSFWLIPQVDIAGMLANEALSLRYAPFALDVHTSGNVESSEQCFSSTPRRLQTLPWRLEIMMCSQSCVMPGCRHFALLALQRGKSSENARIP